MNINTRPLKIMLTVFVILLVIESTRLLIGPRYWLNLSESEPVGLYTRETLHQPLNRGDMVLLKCPPGYEKYLYGRKWLPTGWPLFKTVAGLPGDTFCVSEKNLTLNGKQIGPVYAVDSRGRSLPVLRGCRTVRENHILAIATGLKTSFDGRYFGDVPVSLIIGTVRPVLTFKEEGRGEE
ncbi:MAG: S26 family signal peptidase [Geobacter sp.]|nr:MAG: S26 family signal peptidase [Geobacter sp.]